MVDAVDLTPSRIQIDVNNREDKRFESFSSSNFIVTKTLQPGEVMYNILIIATTAAIRDLFVIGLTGGLLGVQVLYIPPYWLVRLESQTGAVGLDVLSPSEEQLRLLEASVQRVPLPEAETEEERVVAAQVSEAGD